MLTVRGSRKILIVDDETTISDTLSLIFSTQGYEARVAYSAEKALEIIEDWTPDVAILDVVLPGMSGIDLAIVIEANYPACRVVLFSGQPDTSRLLEEAGSHGHQFQVLSKPLHPAFLLDTVTTMLAAGGGKVAEA